MKWDAIDFERDTITIKHIVTNAKIDGKYEIVCADRAKTKSSLRSLPLVSNIREKLLALREQQKENRRVCGKCYSKKYDGYVFVDAMGNIFNPRSVTANFSKLLEQNGLRHIRFHDLRHSCASLLLANDVPLKQIQEWLGHSDIGTTANIYSHLDYKSKITSANVMDNIEAFAKEYFSTGRQDARAMGRMTSVLKPVADRYNQKTPNERYQFRRQVRNLIKWYGYISQILRMFDKELHKEYVFCCYLINLLPAETTDMVDLEGKLKLEYYKLQKTFAGSIELEQVKGVYEPAKQKGAMGLDTKSPLDEIIAKINEKYKGEFTEGDKVLLTALRSRLMADKKLTKMAQTSDPQIFVESIFPKAFGAAAQDSYLESQDTYTSLFEDQHKYNAIMSALADVVYREMRMG